MKYFKHDLMAFDNDKIWDLIEVHGMQGYGIWWWLLENLYAAESDDFQISATQTWFKRSSKAMNLTDWRTLVRVLDTFAEAGLISPQLWAEHTIHADGIKSRADSYIRQRELATERKRKQRILSASSHSNVTRDIGVVTASADLDLATKGRNTSSKKEDVTREKEDVTREKEDVTRDIEDVTACHGGVTTNVDLDLITSGRNTPNRRSKISVSPKAGTEKAFEQSSQETDQKNVRPAQHSVVTQVTDADFDRFWVWYRLTLCRAGLQAGTARKESSAGKKHEARAAWAKLKRSNFCGHGLARFEEAGEHYLAEVRRTGGYDVQHACRYLLDGRGKVPRWAEILEDLGSADRAEDGLPDIHAAIGTENLRLGLTGYLSAEWRQRFGKSCVVELDLGEARDYLAALRTMQPQEVRHAS